ncbi:ABC transporter permease subunit [Cerasicoccus arenae]|uniref:Phosphate ABC transporter permease n=1 Tax=Cerasicoccus arenae TaxID=424488 RepID=A0A8J3DEG9_9BACT|nr:ABC transporter permease subunit [Cerasicoccus arenae]MBK1857716.1 ABC transporter permease subunit [Cerasicoccus arenae]GHB91205.1 phosphate ABC transporter permease [Cerasicoccus arenae]
MASQSDPTADPKRFDVSKGTLRLDNFMTHFIKVGGVGIILAVFAIFLFITWQVLPLFESAKVQEEAVIETGVADFQLVGVDEWGELPFMVDIAGDFTFVDIKRVDGETLVLGPLGVYKVTPKFADEVTFTAANYHSKSEEVIFGASDGRYTLVKVEYKPVFDDRGERKIEAKLKADKFYPLGKGLGAVRVIDYYDADKDRLVAALVEGDSGLETRATTFQRKKTPFGVGPWKPAKEYDLTSQIEGHPIKVLVTGQGNGVLVSTREGSVYSFLINQGEISLEQVFQPFEGLENPEIGSMDWLLGNESLVFTSAVGDNVIFAQYLPELTPEEEKAGVERKRQFTEINQLPKLDGPADLYSHSMRNRAFLLGSGPEASIRYGTTGVVRWEKSLDFTPKAGILGSRYETMLLADDTGRLHFYSIHDPHPEGGFKAFFSKIWYEGQNEPKWIYQSSAADAETEPKFSMVPLIFGTLKGTLYAMIFAIPIALLAALYTSQFLKPEYKKVVKPMMEIMASLPSVVLGFLGALWLAPIIDTRFPSIMLIMFFLPLTALIVGYGWGKLPQRYRLYLRPGQEFLIFIPLLIGIALIGWNLGPWVESWAFVYTNPDTGVATGDFRLWWPEHTGVSYDQRNSLVVGFMMGFAVIPIIFTIAEDAMSNVPQFLTSASLALGASRWQTAKRVVLPTASPGMFSAIMIGFGRAVGETMIVVMATGNTPIMDWNIFSGMRTQSANIAVELPEAPKDSTHFRILFFGALLLFVMTFVVNTVAEVARVRLRNKYKTVG